jgi:ankyrin repeat protein
MKQKIALLLALSLIASFPLIAMKLTKQLIVDLSQEEKNARLYEAALYGNQEACELLLDKGAQLNAPIEKANKETAFHAAIRGGNVEIIQFFIDNGAAVGTRNKWGHHALHIATQLGKIDALMCLLSSIPGIDVNMQDSLGTTPLFLAATLGFMGHARALIKAGGDPLLGTQGGVTPIQMAEGKKHTSMVQLLNASIKSKTGCASCNKQRSNQEVALKCSKCLIVSYCSPACQIKDWPEHKHICG